MDTLQAEAEKLRSSEDNPDVRLKVEGVIEEKLAEAERVEAFYEHGQWWVQALFPDEDDVRFYSVVDVVTAIGDEELDLEEL